jgi:hypothetical protein
MKSAKLRGNMCVEDIDYRAARGLQKSVVHRNAEPRAPGSLRAGRGKGLRPFPLHPFPRQRRASSAVLRTDSS